MSQLADQQPADCQGPDGKPMDTIKPLHFFGFALGPSNATGDVSGPGYDLRKVMKERLDHLLAVEQY